MWPRLTKAVNKWRNALTTRIRIGWDTTVVESYRIYIDADDLAEECGVTEEDVLGWIESGLLNDKLAEHLDGSDLLGNAEEGSNSVGDDIQDRTFSYAEVA